MIDITPYDVICKLSDDEIAYRLDFIKRNINSSHGFYRQQLEEEYCYYFREWELREITKQFHHEWLHNTATQWSY